MTRMKLLSSLAALAVVTAGPALAKPGGGGGHGNGNAGAKAGATVGGGIGVGRGGAATVGSDIDTAIQAGRGGMNAGTTATGSATTRGHAGGGGAIDMRGSTSARGSHTDTSVGGTARLGSQTSAGAQLTGVTDGMTVVDGSGATIGTVTNISTKGNGSVRNVQVTLTDGTRITLDGRSLTLDGDVLTTTSLTSNVRSQGAAHANINGLIHASPNSALNSAGVTTLTGLATGLTVNNTGGTLLGTVQQVMLNQSGAVVGIQVALDGGGTVTIPATTLTMDGSTVVTTFVPHG